MTITPMDLRDFTDEVNAVDFSPDGRLIAAGGGDGMVIVCDVRTGRQVFALAVSDDPVRAVMFDEGGESLVVARACRVVDRLTLDYLFDRAVRSRVEFFDVGCGERTRMVELTVQVADAALIPGGERIAIAGTGERASVRNAGTGGTLTEMVGHRGDVTCVAVSPDGELVATGSRDNTAAVWSRKLGKRVARMGGFFRRHRGPVNCVVFARDGQTLYTGSDDGTVAAWDTLTGKRRAIVAEEGVPVRSVAVSADGALVALGLWGGVPDEGTLGGHRGAPGSPTVRVWGIRSRVRVRDVDVEGAGVNAVAFNPSGDRLAIATAGHALYLVNVRGGGETTVIGGNTVGVRSGAFSPDGAKLAAAAGVRGVSVWDAETGLRARVLSTDGLDCEDVRFGPDARYVAVAGGGDATGATPGSVGIWDTVSGDRVRAIGIEEGVVRCIAFSRAADRVGAGCAVSASGVEKGRVFEWDSATGERTLSLETGAGPVECAAYSNDGQFLVLGEALWDATDGFGAGRVSVWRLPEGRRIATVERPGERVTSVAFVEETEASYVTTPPVAMGLGDPVNTWRGGRTVLWDVTTGKTRAIVSDDDGGGGAVVVSTHGLLLATGRAWSVLYNVEDERIVNSLPGERPLAFSPSTCLATACRGHGVRVWKPGDDPDEDDVAL